MSRVQLSGELEKESRHLRQVAYIQSGVKHGAGAAAAGS